MDVKVLDKLVEGLDPALVRERQGLRYLEGHTAIEQANRIFGFDGWGYELVDGPELFGWESVNNETGAVAHSYAYRAVVRVTAGDAPPRTDFGFHPVQANRAGKYTIDAHDTASKGAVTDALKRALRSFGDQFGNGLYAGKVPAKPKAAAKASGRAPGKPADKTATAAQLKKIDRLGKADYGDGWAEKKKQLVDFFVQGKERPLTRDEATEIVSGLERRAADKVKQEAG